MKALVIYESMFGNTEQVARAIASGLEPLLEVQVVDIAHAPAEPPDDVAMVVAGGPTHAFSMSRPNTRAEAERKGAPNSGGAGLREWLDALPSGYHAQQIATFDTRVAKVRHLPGSAAKRAAKSARRHGFNALAPAESFYVEDLEGPLVAGELDRASAWGERLARSIQATADSK
jgi:hypothetical protein